MRTLGTTALDLAGRVEQREEGQRAESGEQQDERACSEAAHRTKGHKAPRSPRLGVPEGVESREPIRAVRRRSRIVRPGRTWSPRRSAATYHGADAPRSSRS